MAVAKSFSGDPRLFASRRAAQAAQAAGTFATQVLDLSAENSRTLLAHEDRVENVQEQ